MKAWQDGKFVDWAETNISLLSHSFSRGASLFEVVDLLNTSKGPAIFGLKEHTERFFNSAKLALMELPTTVDELVQKVIETVRENNVKRGCIKYYATYPEIELKVTPSNPRVSITIFVVDFDKENIAQSALSKPASVMLSPVRKLHPETVPTHAKVTGAYLNPYLAKMNAIKQGFDDVIVLDTMGYVAEGSTTNLFLIFGEEIVTPTLRSVLPGITRRAVLETFSTVGMPATERDVLPAELNECTEAFFTSSIAKVQPISAIDKRQLGPECPGKVTQKLLNATSDLFDAKLDKMMPWLTFVY